MQEPGSKPSEIPGKRLRVAVLSRQFSVTGGGAERYSIALVEHLATQHEIHVFAQQIEHSWPGVSYHRVSRPLTKPRWLNQLWYATATWLATCKGFDVVHSHENSWHGNVQTVHVLPVKYNLFQGRSGLALTLRWLKVLTSVRLLVYLGLEHCRFVAGHSIVLASDSLIGQVIEAYPDCRSAISVVTPGIDLVRARAVFDQKLQARHRLGLPTQGRGILFVGNDYRKKGLTTLLGALAELPSDCFLMVVGNPAQISQFKTMAEMLSLTSRVFFLGVCKNLDDAYQAADCLAHPTLEDTFAMVVLEAMAFGLPVVVSAEKYCGIAGLLSHEVDALILDDPTQVQDLASAIGQLLEDDSLRERLIQNGLAFAGQHLWQNAANAYDAIYRAAALQSA
jgi:glycosyltransferase involved in cell wall biosynthesis